MYHYGDSHILPSHLKRDFLQVGVLSLFSCCLPSLYNPLCKSLPWVAAATGDVYWDWKKVVRTMALTSLLLGLDLEELFCCRCNVIR